MKNPAAGWQAFFAGICIFFENSTLFLSFFGLEAVDLDKNVELWRGKEEGKDGGVAGGQRRVGFCV